jgi:hypothetical protein
MRRWGIAVAVVAVAFAAGRMTGSQAGRRWVQYDGRE